MTVHGHREGWPTKKILGKCAIFSLTLTVIYFSPFFKQFSIFIFLWFIRLDLYSNLIQWGMVRTSSGPCTFKRWPITLLCCSLILGTNWLLISLFPNKEYSEYIHYTFYGYRMGFGTKLCFSWSCSELWIVSDELSCIFHDH